MSDDFDKLFERVHELYRLFPDLVLQVEGTDFNIRNIPPWVAPWLGDKARNLAGTSLGDLNSELAKILAQVCEEVVERGQAVSDFCAEFDGPDGLRNAVLIFADRMIRASQPDDYFIMVRLHDVSTGVRGRQELSLASNFQGLLGQSEAMRQVFRKIAIYGPSEAPVVVTGETGVGKELVATALHRVSSRRSGPFIPLNCSAIAPELFESECFGHERGSFTGANKTHAGRFERASGGTLFLDEIGDMPLNSQAKLLRVLETGKIERIGGDRLIDVDVRILAATNLPLEQAVGSGSFRADLFHRLSVFRIHVAPLREHREDVSLLANHFLDMFKSRYERSFARLTTDALQLLANYTWPGNVRELRNVIERVIVETTGGVIGRDAFKEWAEERISLARGAVPTAPLPLSLPPGTRGAVGTAPPPLLIEAGASPASFPGASPASFPRASPASLDAPTIQQAFRNSRGNLTQAARLLGVHKATLYRRMKTLGIKRVDLEQNMIEGGVRDD